MKADLHITLSSTLTTTVSIPILWRRLVFPVAMVMFLAAGSPGPARAQAPDPAKLKEAAQQRGQRAESFLRQLDANHNGQVDANELNAQAKSYLDRMASRYGLQASAPLAIEKFRDSVIEGYIRTHSNGPAPAPTTGTSSAGVSSVAGLGMAQNTSNVAGFGTSATSSGRTTSASGASPSAASSAVDERYRTYAANMLKRYDKNGNGVLDRDEWSQMRGDWWKSADTSGDGTITLDEIVGRLSGYRARYQSTTSTTTTTTSPSTSSYATTASTTSSGAVTTSSSAPAVTSTTASPTTVAARKPYRFLTPTERLPSGLPEWFTRRDANGDGQVTLAEFSDNLSDEVAAEFSKYDLNNDGVITPQECLNASKAK